MNLNYREYGQGEVVIILHGLLGMLDNWHSFSKKLSENYWVIALDQRNHGKSAHHEVFDYKQLSEDLYTFMLNHQILRCHLIGHSMGGKTVMQFLNDHASMVEKAVVVDIAPKSYGGGHEKIFEALLNIDIENIGSRKEVQEQLMGQIADLGVVLFLMKNLSRNSDGTYRWKANIPVLWKNYSRIIADVDIAHPVDNEVLFIKGEKSNYISGEDAEEIKLLFPNSEIASIADAGHWVHADQPDLLLKKTIDFLR